MSAAIQRDVSRSWKVGLLLFVFPLVAGPVECPGTDSERASRPRGDLPAGGACKESSVCRSGVCDKTQPTPLPGWCPTCGACTACGGNEDCAAAEHCTITGTCDADQPAGGDCLDASGCLDGQCVGNKCTGCTADTDCGAGQYCDGSCKARHAPKSQCTRTPECKSSNEFLTPSCTGSVCVECLNNGDCASAGGGWCEAGVCVSPLDLVNVSCREKVFRTQLQECSKTYAASALVCTVENPRRAPINHVRFTWVTGFQSGLPYGTLRSTQVQDRTFLSDSSEVSQDVGIMSLYNVGSIDWNFELTLANGQSRTWTIRPWNPCP